MLRAVNSKRIFSPSALQFLKGFKFEIKCNLKYRSCRVPPSLSSKFYTKINFSQGRTLRISDCGNECQQCCSCTNPEESAGGGKKDVRKSGGKKKKKSLWERIKEEAHHYYHGSQLLYLNIKVSKNLFKRTLKGHKLSRREKKLLSRTVSDLYKLIPFSLFVIIPLLEFTLPFFLIMFPEMLPSTYETKSQKEKKIKKKFMVQLEMTKFLQNTLQTMKLQRERKLSQEAIEFANFFEKVRISKGNVTPEDVMKYSKLFHDEITLSNLPRPQVKALCRMLGVSTIGTTAYLANLLELKVKKLKIDDKLIHNEGIDSLRHDELIQACEARGIPVINTSESKLRQQLSNWIDLSNNKNVPPSLLLLSQALVFPPASPEEKLVIVIASLPQEVVAATEADMKYWCGKVDYKIQCECIRAEMRKIKEEQRECSSKGEKEIKEEKQSEMQCALCNILSRKMRLEKKSLAILTQEIETYESDEKSLQEMVKQYGEAREGRAAKKLHKKIKKMVDKLNDTLSELEQSEGQENLSADCCKIEVKECYEALQCMPHVSTSTKEKLMQVCNKLDKNKNGLITTGTLMKVAEIIEHLGGTLTSAQVDEIIDLISRGGCK